MNDQERLELLRDALERLRDLAEDHVILVEGAKDIASLRNLDVDGEFVCIQSSGGPLKAAEMLWDSRKKAVILTDWDRRGASLAQQLRECLGSLCIIYNDGIREDISRAVRPYSKDVESLDSVMSLLEKRTDRQPI